MDITQIFSIVVSAVIFITVILNLTRKKLNEANSILWLIFGVMSLILGSFPGLIVKLSEWVGIDYPPALVFLIAILALGLVVFKNTSDISVMTAKINEMAIYVTILQEEKMQLKRELDKYTGKAEKPARE